MHSLDAIFAPTSIAVLGASNTKGKVGRDIFANILQGGFTGTLYPVNPKARSILSVRCYPSILDIPDPVDLAMVILPPKVALSSIKEAIDKGVRGIIIVSAGFKEVGGEGAEIERRITAMCREAKVRLVGPNCLGVINPDPAVSLNASFSARMPACGNVSFISQSGALCTAVLDFAEDRGFGFSKFVSIGNKADVDELDLLKYYHSDPNTKVIMIYMEELNRTGQEFIDTVKDIASGDNPTPILVIKSGTTAAGAAAAASHTGALAGADAVYDAIFAQSGVLRCGSVNKLFDFATAFSSGKSLIGNRIAIITNAGGPGIMATDVTEISGLALARFSPATVEELRKHLPPTANFHNPVDIIGDAPKDRYENALATVISDDGVDGVLIILTPQSMTDAIGTAEAIVEIARNSPKPIVCSFMGVIDVSEGLKILRNGRVPCYHFPENAAAALGILNHEFQWRRRKRLPQYAIQTDPKRAAGLVEKHLSEGRNVLNEIDASELLACYGFELLRAELATNEQEAADMAEKVGFPVVMKVVSRQILHKTDAGGVKLGIRTQEEAKKAFGEIIASAKKYKEDAVLDGVLVQQMAPPGQEVIVGANRFPGFGHSVMFGLGGIFVEVFKDVTFRITPIGRNEARRMIESVKGFRVLNGFRGRPVADIEAIERALVRLSMLVTDNPLIKELDINPLLVHEKGKGATVADVMITLREPEAGRESLVPLPGGD